MSDRATWFYALDGASVGPVDAAGMRAAFEAGKIGPATLCWQPAFGSAWRPVSEAGLGLGAPPPVPPPPLPPQPLPSQPPAPFQPPPPAAVPVPDGAAWTLALLPLAAVVLGIALFLAGVEEGNGLNAGIFGAMLFVILKDTRQMRAAGVPNPPSAWWVLLPPVYLWKRSNRLGRSKAPFWTLLGIYVLGAVLSVAAVSMAGAGLATASSCGGVRSDVVRIWNTIDAVKRANIVGSSLEGVKEISEGSNLDGQPTRSCSAVVVTSDGKRYGVDYDVTNRGDGSLYVNVRSNLSASP